MPSQSTLKFSDSLIKKLEPNDTRTCNSLELRVWKTGAKTWSFNYRFGDKKKRMSLGQYPYVSISDANDAVAAARKQIALGIDPIEHEKESVAEARRERDEAITVQELYDLWYERHVLGTPLSPRSQRDYKKELTKHLLPAWGNHPVKSITRKMGIDLLQSMADKGCVREGERVQQYISGMWRYALDNEIVEAHPFSRLRKINAPADVQLKKEKTKRDTTRFLSDKEIYQFWYGSIEYCEPIPGAVLRLMLLLGRRGIDVRPMLKNEIDKGSKVWHMIPGKIRQKKRAKYVPVVMPLPPLAFSIITEMMTKGGTKVDLMFPSNDIKRIGLPITQSAISQPITRHNRFGIATSWTPHDLRRTAATGMSRIDIEQTAINHVLAHKLGVLESTYNRNDFLKTRLNALTRWNDHVFKIISGPEPKDEE